jgi:hypothetical protein
MFENIFTVSKISWHRVSENLNLCTPFLIPIWIMTSWCSHKITIPHNYVLYQSNHVLNKEICYFFAVEFV